MPTLRSVAPLDGCTRGLFVFMLFCFFVNVGADGLNAGDFGLLVFAVTAILRNRTSVALALSAHSGAFLTLGGFLAAAVVSAALSPWPQDSALGCARFFIFAVALTGLVPYAANPAFALFALNAVFVFSAIVGAISIALFFFILDLEPLIMTVRGAYVLNFYPAVTGTFSHGNLAGLFIAVGSVAGTVAFLNGCLSARSYYALFFFALAGLAASGSRNAVIAFSAGFSFAVMQAPWTRVRAALPVPALFLLLLAFFPMSAARVLGQEENSVFPLCRHVETFLGTQTSQARRRALEERVRRDHGVRLVQYEVVTLLGLSGRDRIWKNALNAFLERPALGSGPGTTPIINGEPYIHAHNLALNVLAETGAIGSALLFAFLSVVLFRRFRARAQSAGFPLMATMLASCIVDYMVFAPEGLAFLFALSTALVLEETRIQTM